MYFIVPEFNLLGYTKEKFIKTLINRAGQTPNATSLKLRTVYTILRRIYG